MSAQKTFTPPRTGKTLWVDSVFGTSAASALRQRFDRTFSGPEAARDAASAGDNIEVRPGAYSISSSLAKHQVDWNVHSNATITFASDVSTVGIWDDGGAAMSFTVTGEGNYVRSTTDEGLAFKLVNCSHASSNMLIKGRDFTTTGSENGLCAVFWGEAGTLNYEARNIVCTGSNTYANWWSNGTMRGRAFYCSSAYVAAGCSVNATPTGDGHFTAEEVVGLVSSGGSNASAAYWFRANILNGSLAGQSVDAGGNRLYIEAQKLFGAIRSSNGMLYVRGDKLSATKNGTSGNASLLHATGGVADITISHYDPVTFTAEMMKVTGGTLSMHGGRYTGVNQSNGFEMTSGTVDMENVKIDTQASNSDNPITKSGGTLTLSNVRLKSQGSRDVITASTAQDVSFEGIVYGNNGINANITVNGGIFIESNVATRVYSPLIPMQTSFAANDIPVATGEIGLIAVTDEDTGPQPAYSAAGQWRRTVDGVEIVAP